MPNYTSITYTDNLVTFSVDNVITENEKFIVSSSTTGVDANVTLVSQPISLAELTLAFDETNPNQPTCSLGTILHTVINDDTTKTALLEFINNESQLDARYTNLNYPEVLFADFLSYLSLINISGSTVEDNISSGDVVEFIFRFSGGKRTTDGVYYTVKVPFDVNG
jgi:hypothetical protein